MRSSAHCTRPTVSPTGRAAITSCTPVMASARCLWRARSRPAVTPGRRRGRPPAARLRGGRRGSPGAGSRRHRRIRRAHAGMISRTSPILSTALMAASSCATCGLYTTRSGEQSPGHCAGESHAGGDDDGPVPPDVGQSDSELVGDSCGDEVGDGSEDSGDGSEPESDEEDSSEPLSARAADDTGCCCVLSHGAPASRGTAAAAAAGPTRRPASTTPETRRPNVLASTSTLPRICRGKTLSLCNSVIASCN